MTEPESYLRLGIEAAREENKEEARRFFRLLTRKDPDNVQGWLWLAGVAENREERQDALEHVLALDPDNEMAQKGLRALGVQPAAVPPPVVEEPVAAAPASAPDPFMEDDPYGELDNLSDVMAADTAGPVRRSEPYPSADAGDTAAGMAAGSAASAEAAARRAESRARSAEVAAQRSARYIDEDEEEPPRRGLSPLLALLLFLVGLGLIGVLIASLFPGWFGGGQVAEGDATAAALTAQAGPAATSVLGGEGATAQPGATVDPNATADPNAPAATVDPNATADPNAPAATADPNAPVDPNATATAGGEGTAEPGAGEGAPPADVSGANPAILPANSPIQSEGWLYDFPQPTYAASIIGNLGQFTPNNGRFVVVLVHAVNNTGSPQAIPGNFFVLKDAQGRVWEARPEVSDAYVIPGVNADQTQNTPIAPDGNYRSVALVFDVAPDATDLVFFARSNPSQGWIVLRSV
jgi:hypothetical protein